MVIQSNLRRILYLRSYQWVPLVDRPIYTNLSQIVKISLVSRFLNINLWNELTERASKDAELEIRGT